MYNIGLYILAFFFTAGGIYHFVKPKFYLYMMPPYIPNHKLMVSLSGVTEIICGVGLLFTATRSLSAWGIIAMLLIFFTVHIFMVTSDKFHKISKVFLWIRIVLQFVFIYWAYLYV
jgi:uncharacterized membrane protein